MAIDPKKMMAMNGKQPEPPPEEEGMEETPEGEEAPEGGEGEMMAGGDTKFAPIMELLEDAAETIEDNLVEMDQAQLLGEDPLSEDQVFKLAEVMGMLDPQLVLGMKEVMGDITMEEAMELGEHLADEGYASDADLLGGFLFHTKEVLPALGVEEVTGEGAPAEEAPPQPERVSPVANMRR
jgi:hypothetical protein